MSETDRVPSLLDLLNDPSKIDGLSVMQARAALKKLVSALSFTEPEPTDLAESELPELLNARQFATAFGVPLTTAQTLMTNFPKSKRRDIRQIVTIVDGTPHVVSRLFLSKFAREK
jgi:hypothetical protein